MAKIPAPGAGPAPTRSSAACTTDLARSLRRRIHVNGFHCPSTPEYRDWRDTERQRSIEPARCRRFIRRLHPLSGCVGRQMECERASVHLTVAFAWRMRTSGEGPFVRWMGWKACDDLCVTVHEVAAEGFGSEAEVYERSRPTYPADAVAWVVENLRLQPGVTVADV